MNLQIPQPLQRYCLISSRSERSEKQTMLATQLLEDQNLILDIIWCINEIGNLAVRITGYS